MKIAIMTCLFAKGNVNVDAGHWAKVGNVILNDIITIASREIDLNICGGFFNSDEFQTHRCSILPPYESMQLYLA